MPGGLLTKGVFDLMWPALSAPLSWTAALVMTLPVALAAIVGDLVESLIRAKCGHDHGTTGKSAHQGLEPFPPPTQQGDGPPFAKTTNG